MDILKILFENADEKFKSFQEKLCPTVEKSSIIGIKTPFLRRLAKQILSENSGDEFLHSLPHRYFEENQLHAFIIGEMTDFKRALSELERFLPYVDNWATCDQLLPKCFKKNLQSLQGVVFNWLKSTHAYTVRYGICTLMRCFSDAHFKTEYADAIASLQSDEYYINMAIAWYFATLLTKRYEEALPYIKEQRLPAWVHNKTISKACDSLRISAEKKAFLKSLRI